MTKLTAKERRQVRDAAELIETEARYCCCNAVRQVADDSALLNKFCEFYARSRRKLWIDQLYDEGSDWVDRSYIIAHSREIRVLWLLFFAEVG